MRQRSSLPPTSKALASAERTCEVATPKPESQPASSQPRASPSPGQGGEAAAALHEPQVVATPASATLESPPPTLPISAGALRRQVKERLVNVCSHKSQTCRARKRHACSRRCGQMPQRLDIERDFRATPRLQLAVRDGSSPRPHPIWLCGSPPPLEAAMASRYRSAEGHAKEPQVSRGHRRADGHKLGFAAGRGSDPRADHGQVSE